MRDSTVRAADDPARALADSIGARIRAFVGRGGGPRISVAEVLREEVVLGAFQREASALRRTEVAARGLLVTRRASGGPALIAGPGSLHLVLALARHDALVPCAPFQIVNRHVRPLLRAFAKLGATGRFFGRDWVTVAHRPASWVGFAHETETGATVFEAIVALSHPFALPAELDGYPARKASPFLGKVPATLSELVGRPIDPGEAMAAVVGAYEDAYGRLERAAFTDEELRPLADDRRAPWDALVEDAIGMIGASASPLEVGGDFLASYDVIAKLQRRVAALEPPVPREELAATVGEAFAGAGAIEGAKPDAFVDALTAALSVDPT